MMRRFLHLIIDEPIVVILLVAVSLWGGAYGLFHMPVGLFPGLDIPVVNIISHLPGASPEDMEALVTRPVEDRLRTIPGLHRLSSTSIGGISQITAEFNQGVSLTDVRQLVQGELSSVQRVLPAGVRPRLENIGTTLQEVAGYVVTGGDDPVKMRTLIQREIGGRLLAVDGVSRIEVLGGDLPAYVVRLRPGALAEHHLTITAVSAALAGYNRMAATGFIERGSREYSLRGDSRLKTIADVLAVPVTAGEHPVLLGDIADVRPGRVPRHYQVHGDGVEAVALVVSKQPGADTIDVVKGIDRELAKSRSLLPAGAKIRKFYDQADIITEARDSLFHDLIAGALLVTGVLVFFLGAWRASLVVAATIPITLLATVGMMQVFGRSLNVITLSALTLAVGMVVDDTVVVAESIFRHRRAGEGGRNASIAGTLEIAGPDASGTFTTVAAFAPLLFLGGIAGLFVRPFGLVVSTALLASLVVSLTVVPMCFSRINLKERQQAMGARLLAGLDRMVQSALGFSFGHRRLVVVLGVLSLCLGGAAVWLGPIHVLPPIDEGAILVEYVMPPGTSLAESDRIGDILEKEALAIKDVETVYRRTGSSEQGVHVEGVNRGELTMKLKPRSVRTQTAGQIIDDLRRQYSKIPGVAFLYHQPTQERMDESLSGLPAMFGLTIFGPDNKELVRLADRAEKIMAADPALANIINNTKITTPQIVVVPKAVELARLHLTPDDIFKTMQAARTGLAATTVINGDHQIQILVRSGKVSDWTIERLKELPVVTPAGLTLPLQRLAAIRIEHLPPTVTRLNGQREITILAEVNGSISATVDRLQKKLAAIQLPGGYSMAFTGQYQVLQRTIEDFALIGLAAIMLIYLLMALQFGSWGQPLIILITIPVSLVGAVVLLALTGVGIDISVGMGYLTLIGIAVNNAIVLLDWANRQVAAGLEVGEALFSAASIRLRPIIMTAAATIFGLLPVAVNPAVGSRIFQPFAITVIGGLVSATVATLIFIPVLRTFFSGIRR